MLLNICCYKCNFRKYNSYADIRLGDFWGKKFYNNLKGISAVAILTNKGNELIRKIEERINIKKELDNEDFFYNQSVSDYENEMLNKEMLQLIGDNNLTSIIKLYRKRYNFTKKIKKEIKNFVEKLSPMAKYKLKKMYYRIKGN